MARKFQAGIHTLFQDLIGYVTFCSQISLMLLSVLKCFHKCYVSGMFSSSFFSLPSYDLFLCLIFTQLCPCPLSPLYCNPILHTSKNFSKLFFLFYYSLLFTSLISCAGVIILDFRHFFYNFYVINSCFDYIVLVSANVYLLLPIKTLK